MLKHLGKALGMIILLWVTVVKFSLAFAKDEALEVSFSRSEDPTEDASDGSGLRVGLYENHVAFPLALKATRTGLYLAGLHLRESQFTLRGTGSGERRLYRWALPIEYHPPQSGAWSSMFKLVPTHNTDERIFDHRGSQLEYAGSISYQYHSELNLVGGVQADRRFGDFRYYPVLGVEWQPNRRWHHKWLLTDIRSELRLNRRAKLYVDFRPDGGSWRYGSYENHNVVRYQAWRLGAGFHLQTASPFDFIFEYGSSMMRKVQFNGSADVDSSLYWKLSLVSRLPE